MKVIDKIRKLQAHAESATKIGNIAEATAFAAHAQKLLLDYKLTQSDVDGAQGEESTLGGFVLHPLAWGRNLTRRRIQWAEELAIVVAQAHFCRIGTYAASNVLIFFGRKHDVEIAVYIFCRLAQTAQTLGAEERRKALAEHKRLQMPWPGTKTFLYSFYTGFNAAIYLRYQEQREEAERIQAHALVLQREDDRVKRFAESGAKGEARPLKRPEFDDAALRAGYREGRKVNIKQAALLESATE